MQREALEQLMQSLHGGRTGNEPGPRHDRRDRGIFFTPAPLARFVASLVLGPMLGRSSWFGGEGELTVLDPAAGDGRFLAAARQIMVEAAEARGQRVDPRAIARGLIGVERDPALANRAQLRVPGARIVVAESLLATPGEAREVDAVIGNPPYVRSIRLKRSDPELWRGLRGAMAATSHGEWDLYAAFIEASLSWVKPGGRVGLVVPSRWLTAASAAALRQHLTEVGAVRCVIDFGAAQVFPGATTYASIIVLERSRAVDVTVARLGATGWAVGEVPQSQLGRVPWRFAIGAAARACQRAAVRGPTLGELARIAKGAGTNADGVFVLEQAVVRGDRVRGLGAAGAVEVERDATRSCLRGRDLVSGSRARSTVRCIVPYAGDRLIEWPAYRERFPLAAAYLEANRQRLEAREQGRFTGDRFHAFGRPQNLAFHAEKAAKVVVPDVAREGRAVLDRSGALVLDTAYAIRALPNAPAPYDDPWLYLLVMTSPMVTLWLGWAGVPLRGGYVRLKTAFLAPMPMPAPSLSLARAVEALRGGEAREAERLLGLAYGIDEELWSRREGVAVGHAANG